VLKIKKKSECLWDLVSLGEVMIRFDPGEFRIKTARNFKVWEGGGEYNVARGLRKCFKLKTSIITAIVDNDIGYLLEDLINQGGVDMSYVKWLPFDGVGRDARVGFNFTERGFGIRGALGISDRGYSAASKLNKGDIDWNKIFNIDGVRWLHTGGIFAALSKNSPQVIIEAIKSAKKNNTIISYDLNFRASLWGSIGGSAAAIKVNREIVKYVDVIIGNEEDFTSALGFKVEGVDKNLSKLDPKNFEKMIKNCISQFPKLKVVATTLREVKSASINDWSAIMYYGERFYKAVDRVNLEIYDRVGGGDSFASGLIYGFLSEMEPQEIIEIGAAHGALAMTTPGDTTMASLKEVKNILKGASARIER
jgi:2-dehydro-3-deoxygluconokinase